MKDSPSYQARQQTEAVSSRVGLWASNRQEDLHVSKGQRQTLQGGCGKENKVRRADWPTTPYFCIRSPGLRTRDVLTSVKQQMATSLFTFLFFFFPSPVKHSIMHMWPVRYHISHVKKKKTKPKPIVSRNSFTSKSFQKVNGFPQACLFMFLFWKVGIFLYVSPY